MQETHCIQTANIYRLLQIETIQGNFIRQELNYFWIIKDNDGAVANEFWVQLSDGKIRKDKKVRSVGYEGMWVYLLRFFLSLE